MVDVFCVFGVGIQEVDVDNEFGFDFVIMLVKLYGGMIVDCGQVGIVMCFIVLFVGFVEYDVYFIVYEMVLYCLMGGLISVLCDLGVDIDDEGIWVFLFMICGYGWICGGCVEIDVFVFSQFVLGFLFVVLWFDVGLYLVYIGEYLLSFFYIDMIIEVLS